MRGLIAATLFTAAIAAPHYGSYGQPDYGNGYGTGEETPAVSSSYPAVTPEVPSKTPEVCISELPAKQTSR